MNDHQYRMALAIPLIAFAWLDNKIWRSVFLYVDGFLRLVMLKCRKPFPDHVISDRGEYAIRR